MGRHVWSDEKKQEALALIADPTNSYYDVVKVTGVPSSTLWAWAAAAGLTGHTDRLQGVERANKARVERIVAKRSVIAEKLLDAVETFVDKAGEATARDSAQLMQAVTAALTGFRLEMGEATSRVESRDLGSAQKAKAKVDELAERRGKKTA